MCAAERDEIMKNKQSYQLYYNLNKVYNYILVSFYFHIKQTVSVFTNTSVPAVQIDNFIHSILLIFRWGISIVFAIIKYLNL